MKRAGVHFFVPGLPAPQGSKRAFVNKFTKKAQMAESSKRVAPWRNDVATAAMRAMIGLERAPAGEPVSLSIVFNMPRPASHLDGKGRRRKGRPTRPVSKPDVDKLQRSILDALTGICFDDDSQVVEVTATKVFTRGTPGAHIIAVQLDGAFDETGAL